MTADIGSGVHIVVELWCLIFLGWLAWLVGADALDRVSRWRLQREAVRILRRADVQHARANGAALLADLNWREEQ